MGREGQERISPTTVLVVVLCSAFYVDLLIISTTVFAQDTNTSGLNNQSTISASDQQSEIAIVDKTIVPANKTTVKGNVTVISATNNTVIANKKERSRAVTYGLTSIAYKSDKLY